MSDLVFVGMGIILAGFAIVLAAVALSSPASGDGEGRGRVKGGGVILIGPIPIVFGSDARWASIAIVLAIVLILLVLFSGVLA